MKRKVILCGLLFLWAMGPGLSWAQGFLIPTDKSLGALGLKHHRVSIKIQDRAARTEIEQVFVNHTNRLLEATYIFPVPPGATVSHFVLYINGKPVKGQVLVKEKAAAIYQAIVSRMKDPGLVEYIGGNLFRARVYPIPRRGEQKLKIAFTQVVPYMGGLHRFLYPLKTPKSTLQVLNDLTLSVQLHSRSPLKNVYSPTHRISVSRRSDKHVIVGFEQTKARLDRDFVLYYSVSPKDVALNVLTHRVKGEDGYFLLMATPKTSYASKELASKNITFVIDTSGSMHGASMTWAKRALAHCLAKLNPKDHFNVIRFSTDVEALHRELQPATSEGIKKATAFVNKLEAAGGTAIDEALRLALSQRPKGDGVSLVVFLTDGHPTIGETDPGTILKSALKENKYKARVFTFGIGTSINTKLLDLIAQKNGGTGDYVQPNKEILQKVSYFYDKVRYPVLSDITLETGDKVKLVDVYPKQIPDLYRGGQILLFGRYRGEGHLALTLKGKVNGQKRKFVFETAFAQESKEHSFISRIWANRKVAYLLENIRLHGEKAELKGEVIRLAKLFGIVTPYTSYLVVEAGDRWRLNGSTPPTPTTTNQPMIMRNRWSRLRGSGGARQNGLTRRGFDRPSAEPMRRKGRRRASKARPPSRRPAMNPRGATDTTPDPAAPAQASGDAKAAKPKSGLSGGWRTTSGTDAVTASRKLRSMKEQKTLNARPDVTSRFVNGRTFLWKQGQWRERGFKSTMKTLKIKYLSPLYFKIFAMRPALRKLLALGAKVTIIVAKDRALVIGNSEDATNEAALKLFLQP